MTALDHLTPLDPRYPARLRNLADPPASITLQGGPLDAVHSIAIVGTREPCAEAEAFARELASTAVRAGAVVVSGGAVGIDAAAHCGALEAGGRTWAVAATGHLRCFPLVHGPLFEQIAGGPGTMVWPFAPDYSHRSGFLMRNRILVALADAVAVIQAGFPSGALHAASWARRLRKPLWVVPAAPWMASFEGSRRLLDEGARGLTSVGALLETLGLSAAEAPAKVFANGRDGAVRGEVGAAEASPQLALSVHESRVLGATSGKPLHTDAISALAGETCQATTAALLTLALENVVVEGPPGFFRRRHAHNR